MTTEVSEVGVVGAGVIGTSVAHAVARAGLPVTLYDNSAAALAAAGREIELAERLARLRRGPSNRAAIRQVDQLDQLAGCQVVIENVTEDPEIKAAVHRELDRVLAPTCVIAVNTSAVPITQLALATGHPGRVVGAHFMNPVALIDTVEVVRTDYTEQSTLAILLDHFLKRLGKHGVVVADRAGFVINRCLMLFVNEAAALYDEGVADPNQVDRLFRGCLGHRSGPLRTADLIGVDTVLRTLEVLAKHHDPARFAPAPVLRRMVAAGELGRKSGRGFYQYTADGDGAN